MDKNDKHKELTPYDEFDDGIAGYEDRMEGDEGEGNRKGPLEGRKQIVFTNDCRWFFKKADEIPPDREFLFEKVKRVLTHWGVDGKPTRKTKVLGPREKWPLVDGKKDANGKIVKQGLNDLAPKSEWRPDPFNKGKKKAPYQKQWLIFVRDMQTGAPYVYPTSTDGGRGAVHDLIDDIAYMRRRTKKFVSPIMRLAKRWMPTQHGGRDAPQFVCARWIGGDEGLEIGADSPKSLPSNADLSTSTLKEGGVEDAGSRRPMTKRGVQKLAPHKGRSIDADSNDEPPFDDDLNI